jgi:hypothetical protein
MYKIKRFSWLLDKFSRLKLSVKSLLNREKRHSPNGTKIQIKNIETSVRKNPRLYSKNREKIFKESVKNRKS